VTVASAVELLLPLTLLDPLALELSLALGLPLLLADAELVVDCEETERVQSRTVLLEYCNARRGNSVMATTPQRAELTALLLLVSVSEGEEVVVDAAELVAVCR
jgi:hypothetical protein